MAIQGIINGFCAPEDPMQHVILFGRGAGYSLVVDGLQRGEQESSLEDGLVALAKACEGKPKDWREVRETTTEGPQWIVRVTEMGSGVMGDFDLRA